MTKLKKTLAALLTAACMFTAVPSAYAVNSTAFTDVSADAPYASAIEYVVEQGLMSGRSLLKFHFTGSLCPSTS